jgi:tetratricopeptide (TPR) repeat protein
MSDPLRTEAVRSPDPGPEPDRDAKIEQLLLAGLDHYFAAEYEHAINVWTRALFFDRNHVRARAYIDRARSALAERQRESEEVLQNGLAAFRRGDVDEARRLLEAALTQGAPRDEALAALDRLNRLDRGPAPGRLSSRLAERAQLMPRDQAASRGKGPGVLLVGLAVAGLAVAGVVLTVPSPSAQWNSLLGWRPNGSQAPPVPSAVESTLPLPLRGETALARARTLASRGRLHDALAALEAVRATDAQKADADALRADIQRQLIGLAGATSAPSPAEPGGGPHP